VVEVIRRAEKETARYTGYEHSYLIGYNGDREMLDAVNRLLKTDCGRVTAPLLKSYLWTADLPPVDLVIRTGGEPHLSNGFMMWDARDAQLYFTDKFWPDFTKKEFIRALEDYSHRERRFGH
jgi:undecaprenyl diphosphate synthase